MINIEHLLFSQEKKEQNFVASLNLNLKLFKVTFGEETNLKFIRLPN